MFTVRAEIFAKLATIASTEETRYYLCGVYLHRRAGTPGLVAVATDGHRMGAWHDETGEAPEGAGIIVATDKALIAACKAKVRVATRYLIIDREANRADVVERFGDPADDRLVQSFSGVLVDGTFPDWERIIPRGPCVPATTSANAAYVGAFGVFGSGKEGCQVTIAGSGKSPSESPLRVRVSNNPAFIGVLMPMRHPDVTLPDWLADKAEEEKAA